VSGKGKGKAKTFAQAAVAGTPPQQQAPTAPPTRMKTYPREERDLIITTGSQMDFTPTLPKLHSIITDDLTKYHNRLALSIGVRQSKNSSIVITTASRAPASSIKTNIEALLPQISTLPRSTCKTTSECQSGIAFLIYTVPTFERETTKTQEQHEQEYMENLGRQIVTNIAALPTSVKLLRNRDHRESSKSKDAFVAIVAFLEAEPTFAIPGCILAEKTT